jgi:serine protease Do
MKRFLIYLLMLLGFGGLNYWLGWKAGLDSARYQATSPPALAEADPAKAAPLKASPATFTPQEKPALELGDVPLLEQIDREMTRLTGAVLPSVVNIRTSRPVPEEMSRIPFSPRDEDGNPVELDPATSVGSGVIISHEGHIVTNAHVVKDATEIEVQLSDGRKLAAQRLGFDELSDIAVVRVEADRLRPLKWGDSSKLRVGDQVFAVGNPLGQTDSVSNGIVSALGRNPQITAGNYEDFIQTNAAINPGNSGGALVNVHGELIGINTAIASTSRGFQGIGFAIPSNHARFAFEGLIREGKVVRGYLGVKIRVIEPEFRDFYGLKDEHGALVVGVGEGTPAGKAGLQADDVILTFDGRPIFSPDNLRLVVSQTPVGKETAIEVMRNGKKRTLPVTVTEQPTDFGSLRGFGQPPEAEPEPVREEFVTGDGNALEGLTVEELDKDTRERFNIRGKPSGVVISGVKKDSPAASEKLKRGDVIVGIRLADGEGTRTVSDPKALIELAKNVKAGDSVMLFVSRGGDTSPVVLKGSKDKVKG